MHIKIKVHIFETVRRCLARAPSTILEDSWRVRLREC